MENKMNEAQQEIVAKIACIAFGIAVGTFIGLVAIGYLCSLLAGKIKTIEKKIETTTADRSMG